MGIYSKFIAPERRSAPTPARLAEDGKCVFGTFESEFEHMDLLDIKNPTAAPCIPRRTFSDAAAFCA